MKQIKNLVFLAVLSLGLMSFGIMLQDEWVVPDEYKNMKNPTDPKVDLNIGKNFINICMQAHEHLGYFVSFIIKHYL